MVAFSRINLAFALAGLSTAQSFSGPAPSGAFPSGAARPTGGFPGVPDSNEGSHRHGGDHSGFAPPTGGFDSSGLRPSGTGVIGFHHAHQSGEAPFPSGDSFSALPSSVARPSGHHHHHGIDSKGGIHSGLPSGATPTAFATAASGLKHRQLQSGIPPAFTGSFPAPSGGFSSGGFPQSGAPFPTGSDTSAFLSGVAHPSGHRGHYNHHGKGGKDAKHSGQAPSATAPSAALSAAPGLERREEPSGTPPAFSDALSGPAPPAPKPTDPIPSGVAPLSCVRPSGYASAPKPTGTHLTRHTGPNPSGVPSSIPSGLWRRAQRSGHIQSSGIPPTKPTGVRSSGLSPSAIHLTGTPPSRNCTAKFNAVANSGAPTGARPTGARPSGRPCRPAATGFVTSTICGA